MELSLALGRPVGAMSEREFARWNTYFARYSSPMRRLEYGLAQIAMLIATTMGGAENVSVSDYLFDPIDEKELTVEEMRHALDFNPSNVKVR